MDNANTEAKRPHTQLLRIAEVQKRTQLSRASIYNHVKAKSFPAPIKLGKHSRWLENELEQYISGLTAARAV
jgi:prophage regulatory protein